MSTQKIVLGFVLSDATLAATFVATGKRPSPIQSVEIAPEQATPEQRQLLLAGYPHSMAEMFRVGVARIDLMDYERLDFRGDPVRREFDAVPAPEDALALAVEQIAGKAAYEAAKETKRLAEVAAEQAERDRKNAEARAKREAEEAAREAAEADKARWIEAHGSNHLRRAFGRGHDCQRMYVVERAAAELPGYTVDFEDAAAWKSRPCPSLAALDEAERVERLDLRPAEEIEVRIVWLTSPARAERLEYDEDPGEFEESEAIVVRGYLSRYDLVKEM